MTCMPPLHPNPSRRSGALPCARPLAAGELADAEDEEETGKDQQEKAEPGDEPLLRPGAHEAPPLGQGERERRQPDEVGHDVPGEKARDAEAAQSPRHRDRAGAYRSPPQVPVRVGKARQDPAQHGPGQRGIGARTKRPSTMPWPSVTRGPAAAPQRPAAARVTDVTGPGITAPDRPMPKAAAAMPPSSSQLKLMRRLQPS